MYEIRVSKFNHPEQTEGQHTNGPPNVFVKVDNGPWFIVLGFRSLSKVDKAIQNLGIEFFVKWYCEPVRNLT